MDMPSSALGLRDLAQAAEQRKLAGLTVYDASFARLLDRCEVDFLLVGDSLGMTIQGFDSTQRVTMEAMEYHTRCAARGVQRAYLISDMPFMSCRDTTTAKMNAARLLQAGACMVKLEASLDQVEIVQALADQGVPVCAHLGLRPQTLKRPGDARMHGREEEAEELRTAAHELQQAGAQMLLLECVVPSVAFRITKQAEIPVIGIGSGPDCSGQILVLYDILGLTERMPRHAHNFMPEGGTLEGAVRAYVEAVRAGRFPS